MGRKTGSNASTGIRVRVSSRALLEEAPGCGFCPRPAWFLLLTCILTVGVALGLAGCGSNGSGGPGTTGALEGPALSLQKLAEAADAGEWADARLYLDANSIGLAFAHETLQRVRADDTTGTPSAAMGGHGEGFQASAMEEAFAEQFTAAVKAGVESGAAVAEGSLLSTVLTSGVGATEYVHDDEALVVVDVPANADAPASVRLRMNRVGDRWVLIAVEGTRDLYGVFF